MKFLLFLMLPVLCCLSPVLHAQTPVGTLKGRILNRTTQAPVVGATIIVSNTRKGAVSDAQGEFSIGNLAVGSYTVQIRSIGYEPLVEPDVIIRSSRITFLEKELIESDIHTDEVTVYGGYFRSAEATPVSTMEMSAEEIRRAPGSAGDLNRALYTLPAIVQVDDEANDLVVRGGAPFENGFYIDNIFTPNINHFPQQGASGGNIAMLNIDFVRNVAVSAGGFDASWGNRLSSIVDVQLRDGNRDAYDAQIDLNMTGFGGTLEGPVADGSFLLSAKHSYFDLIAEMLDLGASPRFYDLQGKVNYRLSDRHSIELLDVFGRSEFRRSREKAIENDHGSYGVEQYTQNTLGANWRALWGESGYSNTSVSYATIDASNEWFRTATGDIADRHSYLEQFYTLRNTTTFQLASDRSIDMGGEWQFHRLGGKALIDDGEIERTVEENTGGLFASLTQTLWQRLTVQAGLRVAWFFTTEDVLPEPRLRLVYAPGDALSFHAAYAVLHQSLPPFLTAQHPANTALPTPQAKHYIAGVNYLLADDIRLTVEGYAKEYSNFPLSPQAPVRFVVDDVAGDDSDFNYYGQLVTGGKAYTRGVELLLQKKFADSFYGIMGASYFRSRYRDLTGTWRNRLFDNRFVYTLSVGWKPNDEWELSARWIYAGGKAYTPIDVEQSRLHQYTVRDASQIMEAHYPAYHSLNFRVDRRFYFMNTNLIVYINLLNAYNQDNIRSYYWDGYRQEIRHNSMLPLLPILGVEYEL